MADRTEYMRAWHQANRDRIIAKAKIKNQQYRETNRALVIKLKSETPCADCGIQYHPHVMDFDHIDGDKVMNISRLANRGSTKKLLIEIKKCEIVCANCHRMRTWFRGFST